MCKVLKVPRSVYYYHKQERTNSYVENNKKLDKVILEKYNQSKGRYGSPKIQKKLEKDGIKVSQKRVARRMKILIIIIFTSRNKPYHLGSTMMKKRKQNSRIFF